jgi:hypothetical protein
MIEELASVEIECEEDGFYLVVEGHDPESGYQASQYRWKLNEIDLDAFYDQVKARIGPYLRERDEARRTLPARFECDPDESGGYDLSDPKHPDFHSVHADIWDMRDGK